MIEKPKWLPEQLVLKKEFYAIFIIWLFQLSAIIGIGLGYESWFIEKTPLNLLLQLALLFWVFPIKIAKTISAFVILFAVGMIVEIIGVATGFPFGEYSYGGNLGLKFVGVPLLIGCNWAVLVFAGAAIANKWFNNLILKSLFGGALMVLLDVPIELVAPRFDFWQFAGHPPIENYLSWFIVGLSMHVLFHKFKIQGNFNFSLNLILAQFLFFTLLALYL